jgi:hypothetical protein
MKTKVLLFFIVALFFFNTDVIAQNKTRTKTSKGSATKNKVEKVEKVKAPQPVLQERESVADKKSEQGLDTLVVSGNQVDSLLNVIRQKDLEIAKLKANVAFVDTCMVRLANRWLFQKYDKSDVDDAIKYFDRIYSSKLKEDMSIVQELLSNYERSYKEFQKVLKEAQNDIDRENPFAYNEYKNKYIKKIENMSYYKKYYKSGWNIRYLNGQIDEALGILKKHSKDKKADFKSLIDVDFL